MDLWVGIVLIWQIVWLVWSETILHSITLYFVRLFAHILFGNSSIYYPEILRNPQISSVYLWISPFILWNPQISSIFVRFHLKSFSIVLTKHNADCVFPRFRGQRWSVLHDLYFGYFMICFSTYIHSLRHYQFTISSLDRFVYRTFVNSVFCIINVNPQNFV